MSRSALHIVLSFSLVGLVFASCKQDSTPITPDAQPTNTSPAASNTSTGGSSGIAGTDSQGPGGTSGDGGTGGQGGAEPDPTINLPGPRMVRVTTPDGHSYYIDTTEVTQSHYAAFIQSMEKSVFSPTQPAFCSKNTTYLPPPQTEGVPEWDCPPAHFNPESFGDLPMTCVDWCDANAYCQWAGKRLCGGVGGATVATLDDAKNANLDEWYSACSNGGTTVYPYGDVFDKTKCNTAPTENNPDGFEDPNGLLKPSGLTTDCTGIQPPYDQIFNMNGNVYEWIDRYYPVPTNPSAYSGVIRGGTYVPTLALEYSKCERASTFGAAHPNVGIGIRCCHD